MKKDWKTTVAGICLILSAILGMVSTLLDGDPTTNPDFQQVFATIIAGVAGLGFVMSADSKKTKMLILVPFLGLSLLVSGCTTTSNEFKETIAEFDDNGVKTTETETYGLSKATVGFAIKAKELGQDWSYTWGGEQNKIAFGQNAQGYDATAQVEMMRAITDMLTPFDREDNDNRCPGCFGFCCQRSISRGLRRKCHKSVRSLKGLLSPLPLGPGFS